MSTCGAAVGGCRDARVGREALCGSLTIQSAPCAFASHPYPQRFQRYDASADLWSVGTILFEMVCGRPPFTGQNPVHLLQNIEKAPVRIPERAATRLSPMCQDLILRLLRRRPQDRLSWAEFFGHPFLSSGSQSGDDASSGTFMEGASGEALTDSVLQAEIRDVARQLDCTKLSREATHVRPSQQDIRDHRERLSRRVDEGARQRQPGDSLGASEGGLLGGGYVIVDGLPVDRGPEAPESGQAAESVAAQDHGVGRMRRVMLDGLPGHLSEPSTLLQLPIAVEEGLEHAHPAARLHNHQCSAGAVWECARDVAAQGQWFDALVGGLFIVVRLLHYHTLHQCQPGCAADELSYAAHRGWPATLRMPSPLPHCSPSCSSACRSWRRVTCLRRTSSGALPASRQVPLRRGTKHAHRHMCTLCDDAEHVPLTVSIGVLVGNRSASCASLPCLRGNTFDFHHLRPCVQDSEVCKEAALVEPVLRGGMQAVVQSVDAVRLRVQAEGIPEPETLPDAAQARMGEAGAASHIT